MTPAALNFTIARGITFSALISCYTSRAVTLAAGATTDGSTTVTCTSTADLEVDMGVFGPGIPAGARVASITNATTFVLTSAATADGSALEIIAREPKDLTDWTPHAQARVSTKSTTLSFDLEPALTDEALGEITIAWTDTETLDLTDGYYKWDLVLEDPDGQRLGPYAAGDITITTPVTLPDV